MWHLRDPWAAGSPVLRSAVIQPAGPTGEAEQGVEGTLHAVQRSLCKPHGQQGTASRPLGSDCNPILCGSQQRKLWKEGGHVAGTLGSDRAQT